MALIHFDNENFDDLTKKGTVVVDFFATWCGPCKMLSPIIEELGESLDDITFIKIDVDKHEDLARRFGVMSIPTLVFFKDGKEVKKHIGFISKNDLKGTIEKMMWTSFRRHHKKDYSFNKKSRANEVSSSRPLIFIM